jgi:hypothetical protein
MRRNLACAALAVLAGANSSFAAVGIMRDEGVPTPGLPGFVTITLTAVSDDPITAFDFVGDGRNDPATGFGFFGPMNHVNPLGQATVFQDFNDLFPSVGADVRQDSQFLVSTPNVVVPPGLAEEGPNLLQGVWAWAESPGTMIPFAQLVIAESDTPTIFYRGAITALVNGVQTDFPVTNFPEPVPLPPVVVDVNFISAARGSVVSHPFATSQGTTPITWGGLTVASTPGDVSPVNAPSLSPTGEFSWQTNVLDPLGIYHFDVAATNEAGSDIGRLTVNLLPSGQPPVAIDVILGDRQRGELITHQFATSEGTPPITWHDIMYTTAPFPTNLPTLSSTGEFAWQTATNEAVGTYVFDVIATNAAGSDVARLTVNLVPALAPVVVDRDLGTIVPGALITTQLLTSQGTPPISWENLVISAPDGSSPENAPSLSSTGQFRWQTSGSDALGIYQFDVTAMNVAGSDVGRISVELRPLPVGPIVADANLGNRQQGTLIEHQFTTSQGTPPLSWSDLTLIGPGGGAPANAPTLSDTGALSWQTTDLDTVGSYHFEVSATNEVWSDRGYLTVDVLDELPAPGAPVVVDVDMGVEPFAQPLTHQFTTSEGRLPVNWAGLVAIGPDGRSPVNAPTLSDAGLFNWQPDEADIPGTYFFDVRAANSIGSDFGHLIVHFFPEVAIPEPSTCLLVALCGFILLGRAAR